MLMVWFIINGPLIMKKQWRISTEKYRFEKKEYVFNKDEDMDKNIEELSSKEATKLLLAYGPEA